MLGYPRYTVWGYFFNALLFAGGFLAWEAIKGRRRYIGDETVDGIEPGDPKHPKHDARWQLYLAIGVVVALIGGAGTLFRVVDDLNTAGELSRDEMIEAVLDGDSTLNRSEASCIVDSIETMGIDVYEYDTEDELMEAFAKSLASATDAELEAIDCRESPQTFTDDDVPLLRELMIDVVAADPLWNRFQAECMVDELEAAELLIPAAEESIDIESADYDWFWLQVDAACFPEGGGLLDS